MELVGFDKVVLNEAEQTVFFKVKGLSLDFGGITKGYAIDKVAQVLHSRGINQGLVDLGGNIRVLSKAPPEKDSYPLGIRDPREWTKQIGRADMIDEAISTSGNYERFVEYKGKVYPHIINPKTGLPQQGIDSVTVIHPRQCIQMHFQRHYF